MAAPGSDGASSTLFTMLAIYTSTRCAIDRLWAMEVFIRVAECGSFSRAAESLNLANATVTTCVRNLERHLQVMLIHRDTRRLRLTDEGQVFLPRARELLQSLASTEEELRAQVGELRGTLHVETPISLGHALLCPALATFAARHPSICTAITLSNQPHNLIERAIDVAIRMDHVEDADLVAKPIYESRHVICCSAALSRTLPPHPAQLDPGCCLGILPEERWHPGAWTLERGDEKVVIQPAGPLHFNNSNALLAAAEGGAGLACVLEIFADRHLEAGSLVKAYPDWTLPVQTFYMVTTKGRANSAKVRAFADFLMEVLGSDEHLASGRAVPVKAIGKR